MMAGYMGGGIGATRVLGWPLSDWAVVLLLFVLSVLTVALLAALIGVVASWFRRPDRADTDSPPRRDREEPVR